MTLYCTVLCRMYLARSSHVIHHIWCHISSHFTSYDVVSHRIVSNRVLYKRVVSYYILLLVYSSYYDVIMHEATKVPKLQFSWISFQINQTISKINNLLPRLKSFQISYDHDFPYIYVTNMSSWKWHQLITFLSYFQAVQQLGVGNTKIKPTLSRRQGHVAWYFNYNSLSFTFFTWSCSTHTLALDTHRLFNRVLQQTTNNKKE